jgi:hypothetical protein
MTTTINASNSGSGGLVQTADASGVLALQTAGTTAVSISASQVTTFAQPANGGITVQKFTSGSGTYTTPANCKNIYIKMCGGGGGGGTTNNSGSGGSGGTTTFGTSLLTANGGSGSGYLAGAGGSATISSPASGFTLTGGQGGGGMYPGTLVGAQYPGGYGGVNAFGGSASAIAQAGASGAGAANTGAGGSGAVTYINNQYAGAGGAAGGYLEAIIASPSATYSYAVGAGGTAGTGGAQNGGAGGSGVIIVMEYYV